MTLPLWQKVKEESEKAGFKLNIHKTKIMASGSITSWQIDMETVADFILGGSKKIKPVTVSIATSVICHEVMGPEAMILLLDVEF